MVDYSFQKKNDCRDSHAGSLDIENFAEFITAPGELDFDIMLEIKDKEKSALSARRYLAKMKRI